MESAFAAIVIATVGSERPRAWYLLAGALVVIGLAMTVPVLAELALGSEDAEIARLALARKVAATTAAANAVSFIATGAIARRYRFRQLGGIQVPHLGVDFATSALILVVMLWIVEHASAVDLVATMALAGVIFWLAAKARREGAACVEA